MSEEWATAIHEAGHAVIGRVLGIDCGCVTIEADDESSGHSITPDIWDIVGRWEAQGKSHRGEKSATVARVMTLMAGTVAVLSEKPSYDLDLGDDADRYQVMCMLDSEGILDRERRLESMTALLVSRHRSKIVTVARELLRRRRLEAEDVNEILVVEVGLGKR